MLTIRAMVRVGPWIVETLEHDERWTNCERCSERIKWIYVCRVDADSPQLIALGGKPVWRIGSTCGPTLMMVSDQVWHDGTQERFTAIKLVRRATMVLELAKKRRDDDWAVELIAERAEQLCESPLPPNLRAWLTSNVGRLERRYRSPGKNGDG
jgi:hypothetical protein